MRRNGSKAALLAMVLASVAGAAPAGAQDVQWSSWTRIDLSGALGTVMRLFGGKGESLDTTFVKGAMIRTNSDRRSSIVDLENGRFIDIDHRAKTYTVITMAELADYMTQIETKARESTPRSGQPPANPDRDPNAAQTEVTVDLKVDRTGEKQKLQGYDAERVFMTVTTDVTVTPQEGEGAGQKQDAGRLVLLLDSWNARDVPPEKAMQQMATRVGAAARRDNERAAESVLSMVTQDPKAREALAKGIAEAATAGGFEMKGTMHLVLLPPGLAFDRDLALAEDTGKKEDEGGARKALGGLLKGLSKSQPQEKAAEESDPGQWTLARVRSEVREIRTTSLAASLFEPPSGYKEVPFGAAVAR